MLLVAWVPLIVSFVAAVLYLVIARADAKQLAGWTFLAAMIALMLSLAGHVARIGL